MEDNASDDSDYSVTEDRLEQQRARGGRGRGRGSGSIHSRINLQLDINEDDGASLPLSQSTRGRGGRGGRGARTRVQKRNLTPTESLSGGIKFAWSEITPEELQRRSRTASKKPEFERTRASPSCIADHLEMVLVRLNYAVLFIFRREISTGTPCRSISFWLCSLSWSLSALPRRPTFMRNKTVYHLIQESLTAR